MSKEPCCIGQGQSIAPVSLLAYADLSERQRKQLALRVEEASKEVFLYDLKDHEGLIRMDSCKVAIFHDELQVVIGFLTPYITDLGYYRAGALYLMPELRGMGIMRTVLSEFFDDRLPAKAWIANNNKAAIRLFTSIGFQQREPSVDARFSGYLYIKD